MFLFTFKANEAVPFKVLLPEMRVIADTEEKARSIAHAAVGSVKHTQKHASYLDTNIVGVTTKEGGITVEWDSPFKHPHLTICVQSEIPAGIVTYGRPYHLDEVPED